MDSNPCANGVNPNELLVGVEEKEKAFRFVFSID